MICIYCGGECPCTNSECLITRAMCIFPILNKPEGAVKHDSGKPKLSLLTRESLTYETRALEYGAGKYGKDNYKGGMDWTRVIDACLRHVYAFSSQEDNDPESGLSHLAHAKACLAMLIYYYENKKGRDDRGA